jgi:ElaB/YqjD/DUF883 family membrane-anchored ribosome-binding protein
MDHSNHEQSRPMAQPHLAPADAGTDMNALRAEFERVREEYGTMLQQRAEQVREAAASGVEFAQTTIRRHPIETLAAATAAGALVAVLLTRPTHRAGYASRFGAMAGSGLSRADLSHFADRIGRSMKHSAAPVMPAVERMMEAVTNFQPTASAGGIPWDRLTSLWRTIKGN